ncbi:O-methyltransferase [Haloactinospora alba]|uniref:O-methyltransferase n=1 Tax=Haloactinospora alba TaxID=405555 RepID=A0A543N9C4_9ACTN|nr:methyltransferase [Haloactinospora alba]TQN28435.1 O-methyltransferase [Haloactinospora alba]
MADDAGEAEHAYGLLEMDDQLIHARAVQIVAELGIADLLADGPRSSEEIAAATSSDPDACYRMLRMLTTRGILTETRPRTFGLTPRGGPLRSDHPYSVRHTLRLNGAVVPLVIDGAQHSLRTGEPTLPAVTGESFYEHLEREPEHAALFDAAMSELTRAMLPSLLAAYAFTGHVVDVGAGTGTLLRGILRATPAASGTAFDTPRLTESAREAIRRDGLEDRCVFTGGDFFTEVPPGGDLYVLKWVLHNWPDEQAAAILRRCRQAMPDRARLLVIEAVLPEPGTDAPGPAATMDVSMLVVPGGRERTEEQYAALLADAGLRLQRVVSAGSRNSVLESRPV